MLILHNLYILQCKISGIRHASCSRFRLTGLSTTSLVFLFKVSCDRRICFSMTGRVLFAHWTLSSHESTCPPTIGHVLRAHIRWSDPTSHGGHGSSRRVCSAKTFVGVCQFQSLFLIVSNPPLRRIRKGFCSFWWVMGAAKNAQKP